MTLGFLDDVRSHVFMHVTKKFVSLGSMCLCSLAINSGVSSVCFGVSDSDRFWSLAQLRLKHVWAVVGVASQTHWEDMNTES